MYARILCAAVVLSVVGCASDEIVTGPGTKTEAAGHYAVPKAVVQLTVELKYPKAALTDASMLTADTVSMSITESRVILVPAAHIPVFYRPDVFSSDIVTIDVNDNGFLTQVAVDVDDKSADFVGKIVDTLGAGVKLAEFPSPARLLEADGEITRTIQLTIDPYTSPHCADIWKEQAGDELIITVSTAGAARTTVDSRSEEDIEEFCAGKICYPALVSKRIRIDGPADTADEKIIIIPDPQHLILIDIERAAAVRKTLTVDFTNGMLSKLTVNKPSEALAVANIPFNVISKIIALPSELIQLKIDTTTKEKDLLEAQKNLLDAQKSLIEAMEAARQRGDGGAGGAQGMR